MMASHIGQVSLSHKPTIAKVATIRKVLRGDIEKTLVFARFLATEFKRSNPFCTTTFQVVCFSIHRTEKLLLNLSKRVL
jgi:hypothetical protein